MWPVQDANLLAFVLHVEFPWTWMCPEDGPRHSAGASLGITPSQLPLLGHVDFPGPSLVPEVMYKVRFFGELDFGRPEGPGSFCSRVYMELLEC